MSLFAVILISLSSSMIQPTSSWPAFTPSTTTTPTPSPSSCTTKWIIQHSVVGPVFYSRRERRLRNDVVRRQIGRNCNYARNRTARSAEVAHAQGAMQRMVLSALFACIGLGALPFVDAAGLSATGNV